MVDGGQAVPVRATVDIGHSSRVAVFSKSEMAGYECRCGRPTCENRYVSIRTDCRHDGCYELTFDKRNGVMVMQCTICRAAAAFRVAND